MSRSLIEELEELLAPLQATTLGVGAPEGPEQLTKMQELLAASEDPAAGFAWLGERVATLPATAGTWVAVYLGGLVERGRLDASGSAPGVLQLFERFSYALAAGEDRDEWEACSGLLGPSIVTQLSADQATLARLRCNDALCAAIASQAAANEACLYVDGLVRQHGGSVQIIDRTAKRGLLVSYANLGTCNHLFTMLQSVLSSDWSQGRAQSPEMLAVAWGENPITETTPGDEAWFIYQHIVDGSLTAVDGAASPASITSVGNHALLVVTNATEFVEWPAQAFAPQLSLTPPSLSIQRELERSEVITLIGQLP